MHSFIEHLPKAELHLHIEGSFEASLVFDIANRNNCKLRFDSVSQLEAAYKFNNLQEFLDIYYEGANVLLYEQDFYELTLAYLTKVNGENVKHVEIFFDPQTHTDRGVPFDFVIKGIKRALEESEQSFGITYRLIMSFLRHLDEKSAFKTLEQGLEYKDWIDGVGLDSSEFGNPPSKFERVFAKASEHGLKLVAHAGEEGPSEYIWEALNLLNITRIDHGNRCLDDPKLVKYLVENQVPLTLCPLSNTALKVIDKMEDHPCKIMLDKGILATIHSDDPAYFGGYMNANYNALADALDLDFNQVAQLAKNSFIASWLPEERKHYWINEIDTYLLECIK